MRSSKHSPSPAKSSFHPTTDSSTYRDLLLFEERLKTNAASLTRRKHRYQLFLTQLLLIIIFLLSEVFLQTNLLIPHFEHIFRRLVPERYCRDAIEVEIYRYVVIGLLCVSVTTLGLFFVSGMYTEKIAYANRYVPHANRALRNFNMYLNVRKPPLQSKLPFNPFTWLFPRTPSSSPSAPPSPSLSSRRRSPSPTRISKRSSSVPIPPIPPSSNPRGELIFSSRVDRAFRDGYDRYRATFERKRDAREKAAYQATWIGWLLMKLSRTPPVPMVANASGTSTPVHAPGLGRAGSGGSIRGRSTSGQYASSSRRSSPKPPKHSHLSASTKPAVSSGLDLSGRYLDT
ncbi:Spo7-like protein-domain-containing protein [Abortiporus biennis]|nr:Spo7-like protein-domain-containing protein [Abortiporus biennis]